MEETKAKVNKKKCNVNSECVACPMSNPTIMFSPKLGGGSQYCGWSVTCAAPQRRSISTSEVNRNEERDVGRSVSVCARTLLLLLPHLLPAHCEPHRGRGHRHLQEGHHGLRGEQIPTILTSILLVKGLIFIIIIILTACIQIQFTAYYYTHT